MSSERTHLRDAVIRGVRDVDAVFRTLTERVVAIVGRTPAPWNLLAKRKAMRLIDSVLDRTFGLTQRAALTSELFSVITRATDATALGVLDRAVGRVRDAVETVQPGWWQRIINRPPDPFTSTAADLQGSVLQRQRALRARLLDPERSWVPGSRKGLSNRIWQTGKQVRREIDETLRDGIRKGQSAVEIAERLNKYLNPESAPLTYRKDGRIVRKNQTKTPYGKHGSSNSRRLARTEISRVHLEATRQMALITPGVIGMRWGISGSHPGKDICDQYAGHDEGLGIGVYPPRDYPTLPHPQCLCVALPVTVSRDEMIDDLVARYGE